MSVFDVSQTDVKPILELEAQELLSTVEGYEDFVQALMNVAPVSIDFEDIPGDSKGYFHTEEKRIAVQENMSESQTLKTMVHEVAHSMLHNKEMLSLTQEKALELFDHDLPVYLLHNDGSETTVDDRKQIMEHEGIFGIEKGDWENERKLRSMQSELSDNKINKEAQFLYGRR